VYSTTYRGVNAEGSTADIPFKAQVEVDDIRLIVNRVKLRSEIQDRITACFLHTKRISYDYVSHICYGPISIPAGIPSFNRVIERAPRPIAMFVVSEIQQNFYNHIIIDFHKINEC
jgi:hypothetical protein